MSKYFLKVGEEEQGPFTPDELKDNSINAASLVKQEGTETWTSAELVEELKVLFTLQESAATGTVETETITIAQSVTEEAKQENVAAAVSSVAAVTTEAPKKLPRKKGNPVITWALSLAAIAGTGYFVYQDMEKNKSGEVGFAVTNVNNAKDETANDKNISDTDTDKDNTGANTDAVPVVADVAPVQDTVTITPETKPSKSPAINDAVAPKKLEEEKKKLLASQAKKKEEEKKQLLAATEAKRKELDRQQQLAAQAAREMEMRNNWPRYVSIGTFKTEGDDKVKPFNIPVYNGFPVGVEKITLRVDYLKKEGKVVGSEALVVTDIPSGGSRQVQATGNKKAKTANVYITGITSRQLHFCYPSGSGKQGDNYYCN